MATDRFMQLSLTRSLSHGFLQCGWVLNRPWFSRHFVAEK
ncbi:hypothetical protein KAM348_44090 [Aeromonas caviae]|uniref:Uncharacterized protein n=1 Tax=Aeromonas caviae TaxID=648 RepID=A0AAI9PCM9_AERCA|nr:hypothetical protein KAM348_44090 [Aeromonas caviae]